MSVLGILAHVDAGKTTLSEALLYKTGAIKNLGRVDHKDTFLDTNKLEKQRGITIFSKQATFEYEGRRFYLQDTPGHVDFSSEMERTLSILDYAILVISAPDGIQAHTATLLDLLESYHIPCFVFVNKTDLNYSDFKLPSNCVDFNKFDYEDIALSSEDAMQEYEKSGIISDDTIKDLILTRSIIPVYKGSALNLEGIDELIDGLIRFTKEKEYEKDFSARCFKITRDAQGVRLSWIKLLGGTLSVRELIDDEKITQIRIYSGQKYEAADHVKAGDICALVGLEKTYAGQGLGNLSDLGESALEPVLTYRIRVLDENVDNTMALKKLSVLSEEDPLLRITYNSELSEIQAQLMGEVQIEVLKDLILQRFGWDVAIEEGKVVYKETISGPVEGVGHFEPLRHYAEVHLLMEPLPAGSGLILETACSEDVLDRNWQRLILYNLAEYRHVGVLTKSPITDMKITLIAGRSHLKHTEGGDFRQASLRAVRQGLRKAENLLLEPFYSFRMEIPKEQIGRAISDIKSMGGSFDNPEDAGDFTRLLGIAPVSTMQNYQNILLSYTKGKGRLSCRYKGYFPCHNTEEVIDRIGYDPDRDIDNPCDSVFCSHGSGVNVKWNHVEEFMHIDSGLDFNEDAQAVLGSPKLKASNLDFDDKELEDIMAREFGPIKRPKYSTVVYEPAGGYKAKSTGLRKDYLIVDGYNMIFSWEGLKSMAAINIGAARETLIDILSNYKGIRGMELVVVFDGYKVKGNDGTKYTKNGIIVVYTKEAQSADAYIESLVADLGHSYNVSVATSDSLIQLTALRQGTRRMSSKELEHEIRQSKAQIDEILARGAVKFNKIGDTAKIIKDI